MLTILAVIIRICSNSLSNVFQKRLTKGGLNSFAINFYTYIGLSILSIPLIKNISPLTPIILTNATIGGIFGALGNYYLIKALSKGELSILGPINAYKALVAMIFAIFLAGEIPSIIGILGIGLLIFGSYIIFNGTKEGFSLELLKRKDIKYRIYALIFTAIEAVFIKNVINHSDILTSFILWCIFGAIFAYLLILTHKIKFVKLNTTRIIHLISLVATAGIMQFSTNFVFEKMNVSYALALFQLSAILNVFLGWKIFNEKDLLKKLIGSLIMVLGAAILIIF